VVDAAVPAFEDRRSGIARELYDAAMERELERWTAEERRKAHVELFL
jgi:ribosomal protein S18 acetylase RimI-like enzyme